MFGSLKMYLMLGGAAAIIAFGFYVKHLVDTNAELNRTIGENNIKITDLNARLITKDEEIAKLEDSRKIDAAIIAKAQAEEATAKAELEKQIEESNVKLTNLRKDYLTALAQSDGSEEGQRLITKGYVYDTVNELFNQMLGIYCTTEESELCLD